MSPSHDITQALRDIERNANEMARLLILAGYPIATASYAKTIGARLIDIDRLTKPMRHADVDVVSP